MRMIKKQVHQPSPLTMMSFRAKSYFSDMRRAKIFWGHGKCQNDIVSALGIGKNLPRYLASIF